MGETQCSNLKYIKNRDYAFLKIALLIAKYTTLGNKNKD